jgi:hypothetical protein
MHTPREDDDEPLIGYGPMVEFAACQGFPIAKATLNKRCSPAINTGPKIIGYFGARPATTKGLLRAWLRAELRPDRPATRRRKSPPIASTQPVEVA